MLLGRPTLRLASGLLCLVAVLVPAEAVAQDALRVAAYNMRHGRGMDGEVDLHRLARVLRSLDADVITLQEVDDRTERTGGVDQVAVLAELLGYRGSHGPHRAYQGGFYGNAVLTRLPVVAEQTHPIPPASGSALAVHEVRVEVGRAGPVSVVSVHLAGSVQERMAQADALTRSFADAGHPVVLAGDFNGRPDDPVVERLRRDWMVAPKRGDPRTYPADTPVREIDYVFWGGGAAGRRLAPRRESHVVVAEPLASDHRPVVATFRVQRGGSRP